MAGSKAASATVLVVGSVPDEVREQLQAALVAADDEGRVSLRFRERPSDADLAGAAAILIDPFTSTGSQAREFVRACPLAVRSRLLVDACRRRASDLLELQQRARLPLFILGDGRLNRQLGRDLLDIALSDGVVAHCEPLLAGMCQLEQLELLVTCLRHAWARSVDDTARAAGRSPSTLRRRCARAGLPTPRALLRLARLATGIHWATEHGGTVHLAAKAAGYSNDSTLNRAARAAFGATAGELMAEWQTPAFEARLRYALFVAGRGVRASA